MRAVQLASVHGLNGLTIGALAEDVGMSKGGICAHFKNKTELQLEVITRARALMIQHVIAPSQAKPSGLSRLKTFDNAWWKYLENRVFEGGCFFTSAVLELDDIEEDPSRPGRARVDPGHRRRRGRARVLLPGSGEGWPQGARYRAEILRWGAGDLRNPPHLEAGPPRLLGRP